MDIDSERISWLFQQLQAPRPPLFKASPETQEAVRQVVGELCGIFSRASSAARAEITSHVGHKLSGVFFWFAREMAEIAVRKSSPDAVRTGLTALILENNTFDFRDMLMVLVLIHHSAVKLRLDPLQLFDSAASLAVDKKLEKIVRAFPRRPPRERSLETFRYEEVGEGESFRYRSSDRGAARPS